MNRTKGANKPVVPVGVGGGGSGGGGGGGVVGAGGAVGGSAGGTKDATRGDSSAGPTLGAGNLRIAVALPEGEDVNEWLAVACVDFFQQVRGGVVWMSCVCVVVWISFVVPLTKRQTKKKTGQYVVWNSC